MIYSGDYMRDIYYSRNPLVKFIHLGRLREIIRLSDLQPGYNVLDVGCGGGHLINQLHKKESRANYSGIDCDDAAIAAARQRCPYATIVKADLNGELDLPSGFFNLIIISEVIEHLPNYEKTISELKRLLAPGGQLIVTFPNERNWTVARFLLQRRPYKLIEHVNSFVPERIKRSVGLEVVYEKKLPFNWPFQLALVAILKFKK